MASFRQPAEAGTRLYSRAHRKCESKNVSAFSCETGLVA
jgi:hypothetical protein